MEFGTDQRASSGESRKIAGGPAVAGSSSNNGVRVCVGSATCDSGSNVARRFEDGDASLLSVLCANLGRKRNGLTQEIREMEHANQRCVCTLERLQKEERIWKERLDAIRKQKFSAEKKRAETELLLELHQSLNATEGLAAAVRGIQQTSSSEIPEDIKVMVEDCFNARRGLTATACVVCFTDFTAADLLSAKTSEKCRHAIYPCGHAVVCGGCAKRIWSTSRKCPICRVDMNRSPKIFKPGRWQLENSSRLDP
ncbi:hypothetical protein BSKO_11186 [Bryopsis sp. KO-2023]|nr:hypothetical protein BSKO_11186 [Bryopsis sp. KO-2023]